MSAETRLLQLAVVVRVGLIAFGRWQDSNLEVPYTDIDYKVYSDAANFIKDGASPYERSTYRYTPLLAGLLLPNCIFPEYGKILFSMCDIMAAMIMLLILHDKGVTSATVRCLCMGFWLFSPFTATISTRGNGEAIVVCMLMGLVYMLEKRRVILAALLYGLAVHWRIYPIVFAPSILIHLAHDPNRATNEDTPKIWSLFRKYISVDGFVFGVLSGLVFLFLGGAMHWFYGMEFLEETYLYHLSRVDPRHNFSPYFYPAYLRAGSMDALGDTGAWFGMAGLAMQLFISHKVASTDVAMAFMIQSMAFVCFNKVSTAQYFVWYLSWLPLVLPQLLRQGGRRENKGLIAAAIAWPLGLAHWLTWAYLLEFQGYPVHLFVWGAGIIFFAINVWCITCLLSHVSSQ